MKSDQFNIDKLKDSETKNWLRQRFLNKVKNQYIMSYEEIEKQKTAQRIFQLMDKDNSKSLDLEELFAIFKKYGFNIKITELIKLFRIVDQNSNASLDFEEFQKIITNEDAKRQFSHMMRKLRDRPGTQHLRKPEYYPLEFQKMLLYLNYCQTRSDLEKSINNYNSDALKASEHCSELMQLTESFMQIQKIEPEPENKKNLKKKRKERVISKNKSTGIMNAQQLQIQRKLTEENLKLPSIDRLSYVKSTGPTVLLSDNTIAQTSSKSHKYLSNQRQDSNIQNHYLNGAILKSDLDGSTYLKSSKLSNSYSNHIPGENTHDNSKSSAIPYKICLELFNEKHISKTPQDMYTYNYRINSNPYPVGNVIKKLYKRINPPNPQKQELQQIYETFNSLKMKERF